MLLVIAVLVLAGCATVQTVETPDGPFEIAILATTDTRGNLEPCG